MGRNKAVEAQRPITMGRISLCDETKIMAMGIRMVVVAVLLMKLDMITVKMQIKQPRRKNSTHNSAIYLRNILRGQFPEWPNLKINRLPLT